MGGLWALEFGFDVIAFFFKSLGATVFRGLWALEWAWHGRHRLGPFQALEWAWQIRVRMGVANCVRVGVENF